MQKKSWFGMKDLLQDAANWTCEMLRKAEYFVEKGHQLGLREERRTRNTRNFEKQQCSQLKNIQRGNQAAVRSIIESFHLVGKEMPISRIVVAVPNATVVLLG
jgi:hypothetical protein